MPMMDSVKTLTSGKVNISSVTTKIQMGEDTYTIGKPAFWPIKEKPDYLLLCHRNVGYFKLHLSHIWEVCGVV